MITTILIAISLSFDSFATAASLAIKNKKNSLAVALVVSLVFGIFQSIMPFVGYTIGISLKSVISHIDHWVAFIFLSGVGIKFIVESLQKNNCDNKKITEINWKIILLLGLATSIDALVVGITFAFINLDIITSIIWIGSTTFIITLLGYYLGKKLSCLNSKKIEILGGLILIIIGLKILLTHIFFS